MKNILIINCGSTSTKYKLFNTNSKEIFSKNLHFKKDKKKELKFQNELKKYEIEKIGFRIVACGPKIGPLKITSQLKKEIEKYSIFAHIHNKLVLKKINEISENFNSKKLYAVFDTDFHENINEVFRTYPIEQNIAKKYNIKKYGYHGIAIESSLNNLKKQFKKKKEKLPKNIIFLHLGGGCSCTMVKNGKSFLTSMELTPLSGLMMTTRCGNVDSDLSNILSKILKKNNQEVSDILSNKSGFFGLTKSTNTEIIFDKYIKEKKEKKGKYKNEKLACEIFLNQIISYVYQYSGLAGGLDLIVLQGGMGQNNIFIKNEIKKRLKTFNLDKTKIIQSKVFEEKLIFDKIKNIT